MSFLLDLASKVVGASNSRFGADMSPSKAASEEEIHTLFQNVYDASSFKLKVCMYGSSSWSTMIAPSAMPKETGKAPATAHNGCIGSSATLLDSTIQYAFSMIMVGINIVTGTLLYSNMMLRRAATTVNCLLYM